ncbi:hypothetical protein GGR57DRAFT_515859 [Xylariaceae sp. FL1272]|nr:hypothetical protein GGR57DRAFT_515859 [Xylariaceae sp. FL1272]
MIETKNLASFNTSDPVLQGTNLVLRKGGKQIEVSFTSIGELINSAFDKGVDDPWLTLAAQESKRVHGKAWQAFKRFEEKRWANNIRSDYDSGKKVLLRTNADDVICGLCVVSKETRADIKRGNEYIPVLERKLLDPRYSSDIPISLNDFLQHPVDNERYDDRLNRWGSNFQVRVSLQISYHKARTEYILEDEFYVIDLLAVSPDTQRQGIGQALIEDVKRLAIKDRLPVYLLTWPDALGFYLKQGFKVHGRYDDGSVVEPDIVMRWGTGSDSGANYGM